MKVGVLGTGLMGQPMGQRLLGAQYPVVAYNRTPEKLAPLREAGAETTANPTDAVRAADCLILMLADATAIERVLLAPEVRAELSGRSVIQMGTIAPEQSRAIQKAVVAAGGEYLEAPLLGSVPQAQSGQLQVMVGASPEQFERWRALLGTFGPEPTHLGPVGAAAATKLALNQLIASLSSAFGLSLGILQHQGVDTEQFMAILRQSALYAPTFDKKLDRMRQRDYARPNFPIQHLLKDADLVLAQASAAGLDTNGLAGVRELLRQARDAGWAESDYAALFEAIAPPSQSAARSY